MQAMTPVTHRRDRRHNFIADDKRGPPSATYTLDKQDRYIYPTRRTMPRRLPFTLLSGLPGDVELADSVAARRAASVRDAC